MSILTVFGACVVAIILLSYALEQRSAWLILIFALAYAASSLYSASCLKSCLQTLPLFLAGSVLSRNPAGAQITHTLW